MARIVKFEKGDRASLKFQPTEVSCFYNSADVGGRRVLQLDTSGSTEREFPGKISQTLQIDAVRAQQLIDILRVEFGIR